MVCTAVIHKEEEWYVAQCPETAEPKSVILTQTQMGV